MTIGILNIGTGNVGSVVNALSLIKCPFTLVSNSVQLATCTAIIIPGVSNFDCLMSELNRNDLIDALEQEVLINKKPYLGICAGMQILGCKSSEGETPGLGWIKGSVEKISSTSVNDQLIKVPHIGWNILDTKQNSPLYCNLPTSFRAYFVHSFHFVPVDMNCVSATVKGDYSVVASIEKENIFGVQYHVEKSNEKGLKILSNFVNVAISK